MDTRGTGRRTLLQRGLAALAGGAALVIGARPARAETAPPPSPQRFDGTLRMYARKRPLAGPPAGQQISHRTDGRLLGSGELLDGPAGARIGEFYTNCFCLDTPFGPQSAGSNLEFQVLQLQDGTLFGLGAGSVNHDATKVHAVVGGTGRYAGARGSYFERAAGAQAGSHDLVELVVTLGS